MKDKKVKPIFVGGYMHSGTTLLHKIVSSHNRVLSSYKETKVLKFRNYLQNRYSRSFDKLEFLASLARIEKKPVIKTEMDLSGNLISDFFEFLRITALKENLLYFTDGTPNNYLLVDQIPDEYKDSFKILLITRDPRDILASVKKRQKNVKRKDFDTLKKYLIKKTHYHYSPFLNALSIKASFKKLNNLNTQLAHQSIIFDYYELTKDYSRVINDLSLFLDLNYENFPAINELNVLNSAYNKGKREQGVVFISNYEKVLSRGEIKLIEFMFKSYFEKYNNYYSIEIINFENYLYYSIYLFHMPLDLVVLIIKRLFRFQSFSKFIEYLKITIRRFN
jgi:hypothetical protein